jgi:selenocysteine lyase/cysteine desulfurase
MTISRRTVLQAFGSLPIVAAATQSLSAAPDAAPAPRSGHISLPDKANYSFEGTHLNAAYTHPLGKRTREATESYIQSRMLEADRNWPVRNSRDEAVALFAQLINASPGEIAVVPSTLEGENLVGASLDLGPGAGVVTDPFHYDASLVMYGELHKRGMPLTLIAPRGNKLEPSDLEAAITSSTRLVAVSLVSSGTGYTQDLKAVCEIAHRKGALVYADIIQAAGAIPIDVKASGVDFCCAGMYKYLMGEFGSAFLYVRADRLPRLKRVQVGWRQIKSMKPSSPSGPPGPVVGDWELGTDTASVFEVSTPDWSALATIVGSLNYIHGIGVDRIAAHRAPMLQRLQEVLPKHGFRPLTPSDHQGSYVVFAYDGAAERFGRQLKEAKIFVTLNKNKIRISPSVYSDMGDVDRLLKVLSA